MQPLTAAVTQWVKETKAGRDAWRDSSEDFNIGDLPAYLGDADLQTRLKAQGVYDLETTLITDNDQQEGWIYDTVLVDRSTLVKRTRARKALPRKKHAFCAEVEYDDELVDAHMIPADYRDYTRCDPSPSGRHAADPVSAKAADGAGPNRGTDWLVEFHCRYCGETGSIRVDPAHIAWD